MKTSDMYIHLKGLQFYAYHGVLPQEKATGSYFYMDINIKTDFTHAAQTDQLEGTISYADIFETVNNEMKKPSQLLEHVCQRIAERLFHDFPSIEQIQLELSKENPPMGGQAQRIGVSACYIREPAS